MKYHIYITQAAERDMVKAADYIEFVLKNPEAADRLFDLAEEKINDLIHFPEKFPLIDDHILSSWGIRFVKANNYLIFYRILEKEKKVMIVRFLYAKSNWNSILKDGFSNR